MRTVLLIALLLLACGCQSLRDMRQSAWVATAPGSDATALRYRIRKDRETYSGSLERIEPATGAALASAPLQDCRYEAEIFTAWAELDGQRHDVRLVYRDSTDDAAGSYVDAKNAEGRDLRFRQERDNSPTATP